MLTSVFVNISSSLRSHFEYLTRTYTIR